MALALRNIILDKKNPSIFIQLVDSIAMCEVKLKDVSKGTPNSLINPDLFSKIALTL